MIKKIFFNLSIGLLIGSSLFAAATPSRVVCNRTLQPYMQRIQNVPAARELIEAILKEGPLHISASPSQLTDQFGAAWDRDRRTIFVNRSQEFGHVIGSILFEMHNALADTKFNEVERLARMGQIDKNRFVESMEYIEYENSLKAASVAEKGIELGVFPANARLPTCSSFEEHFYYQKIGGHSAWFAESYDEMINFRG